MKRRMMALAAVGVLAGSGASAATGLVFVSNEKSSTISVLSPEHVVIETLETCARPRGMHFSADRTSFFVGCAVFFALCTWLTWHYYARPGAPNPS